MNTTSILENIADEICRTIVELSNKTVTYSKLSNFHADISPTSIEVLPSCEMIINGDNGSQRYILTTKFFHSLPFASYTSPWMDSRFIIYLSDPDFFEKCATAILSDRRVFKCQV